MTMVHVCPLKDAECGDSRIRWCATCPKHKPVGMRGPVAFVPAFWIVPDPTPKLDWSETDDPR